VSQEVSNYIVESYVRLRKSSKEDEKNEKSHTYTSARTLLGVLRLSQALARLRFSSLVEQSDVDEALRLMEVSKESLLDDEKDAEVDRPSISKIFRIITEMAKEGSGGKRKKRRLGRGPERERDMGDEEGTDVLSMVDIRARVLGAAFNEAQLMNTIVSVSPVPSSLA